MKYDPKLIASRKHDETIKVWSEKIGSAKPSRYLTPKHRRDDEEFGSLADNDARRVAGRAMIDELAEHHKRTKKQGLRHWLATFCWELGDVDPDDPLEYNLRALKLKVYKHLRALNLSAICVVEAIAVRRSKHNEDRLNIHIHALCWTSSKTFQPKKSARKLRKLPSMRNSFGAASVTFQSRQMAAAHFRDKKSETYKRLFSKLDRDQTKASMTWLGYYLFQAPAWVKQLVPSPSDERQFVMRSNSKNYSPILALKLNRLLSSIQFEDAVFSVGAGKSIRTPWARTYRENLAKLQSKNERRRPTRKAGRR